MRCLWCKKTVHKDCRDKVDHQCTLGGLRLCILPPSAIRRSDAVHKGMWEPYSVSGFSPILALVNSKSGNNQGVRFLRKLKFWLNPVQVFDLAISGPELGLELFKGFESFKVVVFGGDGSIGWVLSAIDRLQLHSKCMVGVVPLGTGNDLARVLGWGAQCSDEDKLPYILSEMEMSTFRLLDRWSIQFSSSADVDISPLKSSHCHFSLVLSGAPDTCNPTSATLTGVPTISIGAANGSDFVSSPQDPVSSKSPEDRDTVCLGSPDAEDGVTKIRSLSSEDTIGTVQNGGTVEQKQLCQLPDNSNNNMHESILHIVSTISSARLLCKVVKQIMTLLIRTQKTHVVTSLVISDLNHSPMTQTCTVLAEKLRALEAVLGEESEPLLLEAHPLLGDETFKSRASLMARANSVKKAVKGVLDAAASSVQDEALINAEIEDLARSVKCYELDASEVSSNCDTKPNQPGIGNGNQPEIKNENQPESVKENQFGKEHENGSDVEHQSSRKANRTVRSHGGSVVELSPPLADMTEIATMNNYFGIGLDAKIAYEFNNTRDKSPAAYSSRTRNMMLYGLLGGKEFILNTQRYLERRLNLTCDGRQIVLPQKLQGLVFLNIPSYMAGTNFWGTDKEKDGFLAPSHDDKLIEVIGITGFTQLATSKMLGIQNHRLAQCHYAQLTLHGPDPLPVQVDGEAWLQEPGTIVISHKNKARMLVKDKVFSQSLETWKVRMSLSLSSAEAQIMHYQQLCSALKPLIDWITFGLVEDLDIHSELTQHATVISQLMMDCPSSEVEPATVGFSSTCHSLAPSVQTLLQRLHEFKNEGRLQLENEKQQQLSQLMKQIEACLASFCTGELKDHSQLEYNDHRRRASDSMLRSPRANVGQKVLRGRHNQMVPEELRQLRAKTKGTKPFETVSGVGLKYEAKRKYVEEWSIADVCGWMECIGLGEHTKDIQSHRISGKELIKLQQNDLEEVLGITRHDHKLSLTHGLCGIGLLQPQSANSLPK